jgi:hypothetical protein
VSAVARGRTWEMALAPLTRTVQLPVRAPSRRYISESDLETAARCKSALVRCCAGLGRRGAFPATLFSAGGSAAEMSRRQDSAGEQLFASAPHAGPLLATYSLERGTSLSFWLPTSRKTSTARSSQSRPSRPQSQLKLPGNRHSSSSNCSSSIHKLVKDMAVMNPPMI